MSVLTRRRRVVLLDRHVPRRRLVLVFRERTLATIALWLGHETTQATQMYLHADLKLKQQTIDRVLVGAVVGCSWLRSRLHDATAGLRCDAFGDWIRDATLWSIALTGLCGSDDARKPP
jgi:hypothetical protein